MGAALNMLAPGKAEVSDISLPNDRKGVVTLLGCLVVMVVMVVVPLMAEGKGGVISLVAPSSRHRLWEEWKKTYGKRYRPRVEVLRQRVFFRNLRSVLLHNSQYPVSVSFTRGLNKFSDRTVSEQRTLTYHIRPSPANYYCPAMHKPTNHSLPDTVDWRSKGYVTEIMDNFDCDGSGYAFAAAESLEGQYFNLTGRLLRLSVQQILDCSRIEGNEGCTGGLIDNSFVYIMSQLEGLMTSYDYPFSGLAEKCWARPAKNKAKMRSCVDLTPGREDVLKHATALVGPIAVGVDASHSSFMSYSGGVYYEERCSPSYLTHGMLVVGYGTYQGQDYWLLKNSWGNDWGIKGYMMMARNKGNNCGIASMASYPIASV